MSNLYPGQLSALSDLCNLLNEWEKKYENADTFFVIKNGISLVHEGSDEEFGTLRDEIGGAWSFTQATPKSKETE